MPTPIKRNKTAYATRPFDIRDSPEVRTTESHKLEMHIPRTIRILAGGVRVVCHVTRQGKGGPDFSQAHQQPSVITTHQMRFCWFLHCGNNWLGVQGDYHNHYIPKSRIIIPWRDLTSNLLKPLSFSRSTKKKANLSIPQNSFFHPLLGWRG